MKIAALCETHYVGMVPHFTGPISLAALVHVLAVFSGPVLTEIAGGGLRPTPLLAARARFPQRQAVAPRRPGAGGPIRSQGRPADRRDHRASQPRPDEPPPGRVDHELVASRGRFLAGVGRHPVSAAGKRIGRPFPVPPRQQLDAPPVFLHDLPDMANPRPVPLGFVLTSGSKQLIAKLRRNPFPVVLDNDRIRAASARSPKADVAAVGRGLDGVGKEVSQQIWRSPAGRRRPRTAADRTPSGRRCSCRRRSGSKTSARRLAQPAFSFCGCLTRAISMRLAASRLVALIPWECGRCTGGTGEIRGRAAFEKEGGVAHHEQRIAQVVDDAGPIRPMAASRAGRQGGPWPWPAPPPHCGVAPTLQKLLVGLAERLLRLLALGDVAAEPHQPKQPSLRCF